MSLSIPARRPVLVLAALACLALVSLPLSRGARAEDKPSAEPMLEVVIHAIRNNEAADAAVRGLQKHLATLPGFVRSDAARTNDSTAHILRATVWGSVRATEAAALACDGHAAVAAFAAATAPAQRRFFRQLRSVRYRDAPTGDLEVTLFRTRVGTTRGQNLARFDAAEPDFAKGPGIVGHSMWIAPDGMWAHVVHWESEAAFAKTGKALMRTKGVGGWIRSLDFKRFKVWKGDTIR